VSGDGISMVRRLRMAFALGVGLVVLVGLAGAGALALASERVGHLTDELTPAVEANGRVLQAMLDAQTGLRGYQLTGDPAFLEPHERGLPEVGVQIEKVLTSTDDPAVAELMAAQQRSAQAWLQAYAQPGDVETTRESLAAKASFDDFREVNATLTLRLTDSRAAARGEIRLLQIAGLTLLAMLTVACAGVGALAAGRTERTLRLPLLELGDVLERLRMGESSARVDPTGPREFAIVARAANAMADESERLRETQRESARLRRAAHEASRSIQAELDRVAVLQAAAVQLGDMLGLDRIWITQLGGEALGRLWSRPGLRDVDPSRWVLPGAAELVRRLRREGEVHAVPNVLTDAHLTQSDEGRAFVSASGATAMLVAPVGGNDETLALATLMVCDGPRDFHPEEVTAVQSVCADLGRALEHSLLFERQLELVDRLQELDRQKTDFLSTVSHELRTPLTSISGYAEMLRDGDAGPVTAPMAQMLEVIERNTVRLKVLIEDLLTLSAIESAAFRSSMDDVDVATLVRGVEQAVRPQAAAAGLDLRVGRLPSALAVRGDELQLERVLLNLVSNAIKFTPAPGRVDVGVSTEDGVGSDLVVLSVRDTGIGIPEAEQDQLFSRFFRASNAVDRAVPGTGLGLTIVRSIVEHHGGSLELDSSPGRATTFTVRLPLVRPEEESAGEGPHEEQDDGQRRFDALGLSLAD